MSSLSIFTKINQSNYGWREDPNSYYSELNIKDNFETNSHRITINHKFTQLWNHSNKSNRSCRA